MEGIHYIVHISSDSHQWRNVEKNSKIIAMSSTLLLNTGDYNEHVKSHDMNVQYGVSQSPSFALTKSCEVYLVK